MKKVNVSSLLPLVKNNQRVVEYRRFSIGINLGGWIRIGASANQNEGGALFSIYNTYMATNPGIAVFLLGIRSNQNNYFHLIHRVGGPVSKSRIVTHGTVRYFEVFIPAHGNETLHIYAQSMHNMILYDMPTPGEVPEGGSQVEYSL